VLVVTLLLLMALTALAHAALVTARTHRRAGGLVGQARARHWSAVSLAVDRALGLDSLAEPLPVDPVLPGAVGRTELIRLSPELALVRARVDSAGSGSEAGALVWALDPATRIAALARALEVGRAPDAASVAAITTGESLACPPDSQSDPARPLIRALDPAAPDGGDPLALGRLPSVDLLAALDPLPDATGGPAPATSGGACGTGLWNWGALSPPDHPCHERRIAAARAGDLRLVGGEGQGLLAVTGRLELVGTRFHGLVLTGGDLVLRGGAEIEGVARVGGTVLVDDGSWIAGPCAARRALEGAGGLRAPRVLPRPGWTLH
jgi:hypothetical protein